MSARRPGLRTAVDIGGTFTDLVLYDDATGGVKFEKALSTPRALADAILQCLAKAEAAPAAIAHLVHGSTVAINAVIQRKGALTALVTTAGFEDVHEIGRANRPDTFNLFFEKPAPLVPATRRFGVVERVGPSGEVRTPLSEASLKRVIMQLKRASAEAVAICLLHSYANPAHEAAAKQAIEAALPGVYVTASHEILREYREYERGSTTVLNAFVGPEVNRYLTDLGGRLKAGGFSGVFHLMQSNGGVMSAERARQVPVAMMESGPAGGIIGAAALGRVLGHADVIAFDMGGTTAKTCLVERGLPKMTEQYFIGGYRDGFPLRLPVVDIVEVGAGGGSIAWIDAGGALKVGPQSAGAEPGPACYGRGGAAPTVTDVNLLLGRLNPRRFFGGEFDLDTGAAEGAVARIGQPLQLGPVEAAAGILTLADARMSFAVRAITLQRGYDPRDFAMVAFGGAGPLHAAAIARELSIPTVIIPPQPGHFSALGMLLTDLRHDHVLTRVTDFARLTADELGAWFQPLEEAGRAALAAEAHDQANVLLLRSLDMRYAGQEYTVTVPVGERLDGPAAMGELRRRFDAVYEQRYGHAGADDPAEIVNLRLTCLGAVGKPDFAQLRDKRIAAPAADRRPVYFAAAGGFVDSPVQQRAGLQPGAHVAGPAVIEEYASTTILHPGDRATVEPNGCLVLEIGAG
ncbi:MAG: hydantoinase/oxoprolinase family protein [Alphaproteobacteria bacterium]|nr:hydantoinase/oxoprolinase family protein [Alphaproteobacteria bacterium]